MKSPKKTSKTASRSMPQGIEIVAEDHVVYVRAMFPISLSVFTAYLEENGFKNCLEGRLNDILKVTAKYVCVNLTKKVYVYSTATYKNPTLNADEFKEEYSGFMAGSNYGI